MLTEGESKVLSELRTQKPIKAPWNADYCSSLAMKRLVTVLARRQADPRKLVVVREEKLILPF